MICKIERLGKDPTVLRVSGRIDREQVPTLRGSIEQEQGVVTVDLAEIILVDREAVMFLALSEATGIELRNCPAYVREWIARERCRWAHPLLTELKKGSKSE